MSLTSTKTYVSAGAATLVILAACAHALAVAPAETTVMVLPARYRVVQLAFDLDRFDDLILVSYQQAPGSDNLALHQWDGEAWQALSIADYAAGQLTAGQTISQAVLVGDDETLPNSILNGTGWAPRVHRIESLNIVDMVNQAAVILHLSPRQIRWLAGRYKLQLEDQNWERRRWGRYGPPPGHESDAQSPPERERTVIHAVEIEPLPDDDPGVRIESAAPGIGSRVVTPVLTEPSPAIKDDPVKGGNPGSEDTPFLPEEK